MNPGSAGASSKYAEPADCARRKYFRVCHVVCHAGRCNGLSASVHYPHPIPPRQINLLMMFEELLKCQAQGLAFRIRNGSSFQHFVEKGGRQKVMDGVRTR